MPQVQAGGVSQWDSGLWFLFKSPAPFFVCFVFEHVFFHTATKNTFSIQVIYTDKIEYQMYWVNTLLRLLLQGYQYYIFIITYLNLFLEIISASFVVSKKIQQILMTVTVKFYSLISGSCDAH